MYKAVLLVLAISFAACKNSEKKFDKQTYEQNKESLADKEKRTPLSFLQVEWNDHRNFFGRTVVKGSVTNNASVTAYKDVRIKMLCYKASVLAEEHEDVLKDAVQPNSTVDFKLHYKLPHGTDSIALSVMSAVAIEKK
jgi:hypothetical protein